MVNNEGQFYTMEGIAAAIMMVITASLVVSTTSVYTPGDTHIQDMQLEQLGNDALKILDTPATAGVNSTLEDIVCKNDMEGFKNEFLDLLRGGNVTGNLHFTSSIFYINRTGDVKEVPFSSSRSYVGNPNSVRVTRWVFMGTGCSILPADYNNRRNQTVLLEVLIWRE